MAGDEGKKVNGDEGSSEQIEGELAQQIRRIPPGWVHDDVGAGSIGVGCGGGGHGGCGGSGCGGFGDSGGSGGAGGSGGGMSMQSVNLYEGHRTRGPKSPDLVSKEETAAAYVYKMDKTWLTADRVRVEIRRGHALWVIGQGDEPVKVELPRNSKMRVREATASMSPEGVLTVVIPKRQRPRKWYKFTDLVFLWFKTVHVEISS